MNPRIRLEALDTSPYQELIEELVDLWIWANRPAAGLTHQDYTANLRILLLTTQSAKRTCVIVQAILQQAVHLDKDSQWVEQELKFEGMLNGADRADFLLFELQQASEIDDQLLDAYNERLNRFAADAQ